MVDVNKISKNLNGYTKDVLKKLEKDVEELKEFSIASKFDKELSKRLSKSRDSTK